MNCMFCESEINENDIIQEGLDARIAGQKTCPLEGRFPLDPFFEDPERRMALSRCIRKLCEQSDDNRLQGPLNLQKLSYLWMKK